jgi:MFS family permease
MSSIKRALLLITLMFAGEGVFILPFVVSRIFRPTFLEVFGLTNLELGSAFSVYGIVAMFCYFLGGPLADRFPARKLLAISLVITGCSGFWMASIPSLVVLTLLYAFWGISTILLFWAPCMKAVRLYGGEQAQGRSYGTVDAGRGLFAALLGSLSVLLFSSLLQVDIELATTEDKKVVLGQLISLYSALIILVGVVIWWFFPKSEETSVTKPRLSLRNLGEVVKRRTIWLQAFIVLCAYVGYKCTDDFSLYASDAFAFDDIKSAHIGTVSFWVRPIAAVLAGWLGDKIGHAKVTRYSFAIVIFGSLVIALGLIPAQMISIVVLNIAITSLGIYGLRGLYYALFQEARIPLSITGSSIGFISVIGYTPDIFMGPLMGVILDKNPGALGHHYLFGLLATISLFGLIASGLFQKASSRI